MSNPLQILIPIWLVLILLLLLFKFNNWVDSRPAKKKEDKPKKDKKEETIKKIDEKSSDALAVTKEPEKVEAKKDEIFVGTNYLYDRFVVNPSEEDKIDDKKSELFLSTEESEEIKNKKVEIKVKPVESLSQKEALYRKIEEMTNKNVDERERLLEEFESLPRNTKLMLIENIIQKMN